MIEEDVGTVQVCANLDGGGVIIIPFQVRFNTVAGTAGECIYADSLYICMCAYV